MSEENLSLGWISIYRSIQNKGWYKNSKYVHLWVHILLKANHKENEFWFNGENIKVSRGKFICGRKSLSFETGINESTIERILKTFEKEKQIEQQKTNRNRLISILNYKQYQSNEQQTNNKRTTDEQPTNTNNNDNNINKENKAPSFEDFLFHALSKKPNIDRIALRKKYDAWNYNNWFDGNGKKIKNWKLKLNNNLPYIAEKTIKKQKITF